MSRERENRKQKLNKRVDVIKKTNCVFCSNDKLHSNGLRFWCTKCKREKKPIK